MARDIVLGAFVHERQNLGTRAGCRAELALCCDSAAFEILSSADVKAALLWHRRLIVFLFAMRLSLNSIVVELN